MRITVSLSLPRDQETIPIARHIAGCSMEEVGVDGEAISDIAVALSEACTNVLKHSGPGDEYEVSVDIDGRFCTIRVKDAGRGFDSTSSGERPADVSAEQGRGIDLMRALVDQVRFVSKPEEGTVVHLEKLITYGDGALAGADGIGR